LRVDHVARRGTKGAVVEVGETLFEHEVAFLGERLVGIQRLCATGESKEAADPLCQHEYMI
jgi:hypothetical protein